MSQNHIQTSFYRADFHDVSRAQVLAHYCHRLRQWDLKNILLLAWIYTGHKKLRLIPNIVIQNVLLCSPSTLFSGLEPISWRFLETLCSHLLWLSSLSTKLSSWRYLPPRGCTNGTGMERLRKPKNCSVSLSESWSHWIPRLKFVHEPSLASFIIQNTFHLCTKAFQNGKIPMRLRLPVCNVSLIDVLLSSLRSQKLNFPSKLSVIVIYLRSARSKVTNAWRPSTFPFRNTI